MNLHSTPEPLIELVLKGFRNLPTKPGVYIVFWVREGKPVPIPRILSVDERGVLYIGSTGKGKGKDVECVEGKKGLRDRIRELWISIEMVYGRKERRRYPHTFGPSLIYTGLYKVISVEDLWIYYKVFNACEAEDQEKLAILEYTSRYGEPPPLNLQVGRQYFMILGLGELGKSKLVGELDPELRLVLGL
uniref:GIY-YIG nuclease family protein n=1 Tax=Ignisphaera aggregans TaxID=334771 RepID=A0A7J2TBH3_9CREN